MESLIPFKVSELNREKYQSDSSIIEIKFESFFGSDLKFDSAPPHQRQYC